jgi:excisionase family DNA binding protein
MKGVLTEMPQDLMTVRQVARFLRVDDTTVRRWVKEGALEAVLSPHGEKRQKCRIKRATIDTLLGQVNDNGQNTLC